MNKFKLSFFCCLLSSLFLLASCKKEITGKIYGGTIAINASQEVPANASTATGTMNATYDQLKKTMSYTITWTGLTGAVSGMHIHGVADPGFNAGILQGIIGSGSVFAANATTFGASGTASASMFVDDVVIREVDLLAGKLYVNIHTATYPGGEIRGQIILTEK